ncbi:phage head closure protein [Cytobacillus oceanisediminis]|uniref:phage head closure protein n=1 Tax=Cytobacillus oceanisediminis TaxID=665099 RepID=UPI002040CA16|nr:phage head closure protein [Cytobacillus oceanisediminis]MCM3242691.1 phage head closure protein [Cytobacillus oceanisediminis]
MKSLTSKLNHRISIMRPPDPELDVDEAGQPLEAWVPVAETWAAIRTLRGRELSAAQQINAEITTEITIRYRTGIDRTMKAMYMEDEFEFLYVIHKDYAKKELQIFAKVHQ